MRFYFCILNVLLFGITHAQTSDVKVIDRYYWTDKDKAYSAKIDLYSDNGFELIVDSRYDCTPDFVVYGRGEYDLKSDSLTLAFDRLPTLPSESHVDSLENTDGIVDIEINVYNEDRNPVSNVEARWSQPKR